MYVAVQELIGACRVDNLACAGYIYLGKLHNILLMSFLAVDQISVEAIYLASSYNEYCIITVLKMH